MTHSVRVWIAGIQLRSGLKRVLIIEKYSQILSFSPPLPNSPTANPQISLAESTKNVVE
ncbi:MULTISPECIES: hypothetical protein [unclassified Microcoleus]|uniref:hypothetical protein n=1 Tax=unclassified Microcoleus TaxID=2642155 RepID=UPI002FD20E0D